MRNHSASSTLFFTAIIACCTQGEVEVALAFQATRLSLPIVSVFPSTSPNRSTFGKLNVSSSINDYGSSSSSYSSSLTRLSRSRRRQILTEDDLAKPPNQKLIEVIDSLPPQQQQSIIASDMASQTGLSLAETQQSLSSLASLTRGDISVTSDGELVYTFPQNVQSVLKNNSLRYKFSTLWSKTIWPKLFWALRVSFGILLFVSIVAIFSTLFLILISAASSADSDDDSGNWDWGSDDDSGGSDYDSEDSNDDTRDFRKEENNNDDEGFIKFRYGYDDFANDVFHPRPYLYSTNNYGYYSSNDPYSTEQFQEEENTPIEERGGLFESIFSYIFGDGDPNRNLERARLRLVSRLIRANGGAVTAEQLAPFCDVEDPDELIRGDFSLSDEGFVLPIVSQLGGVPSVTKDGDIVYLFPDLQISTMKEEEADMLQAEKQSLIKMDYLQEMNVDFSRNEPNENVLAGGLGVVNLVGAIYLGKELASPAMSGVQMAGLFGLVQTGYSVLLIYAILFNMIPAIRFFNNKRLNERISKRNSARRKWLAYLQEVGGSQITRKLVAAKSLRQKIKRLVGIGKDTVYDTRTEMEDLTAEKEAEKMRKFDDLLGVNDMGKNDDCS